MIDMDKKIVIVTGGGSGIGEATCKVFSDNNATVVVTDINYEKAEKVANDIIVDGKKAISYQLDTSDEKIISIVADKISEIYGGVDILVNCAARFIMKGIDATLEDWQSITSVNIAGYALCAKYFVPSMINRGGGAIVNVGSISGYIAQSEYLTYNATKGSVIAMTRCMALDLAKYNIRVNSVNPGTVWTKSNEDYFLRTMNLDRKAANNHPEIGGAHILKRTADPIEIAYPILFLASKYASFITGENLLVDGGYTAI